MSFNQPWYVQPFWAPEGEGEGGEGAGGEGEGGGGEDEGEGGGEGKAWYGSFDNDDAKKVAARYADPQAMALAQIDLRERNSKMINVPDGDADEETIGKFRKAIGAAADPEAYTKDMDWSSYGEEYEPTEAQTDELQAFASIAAESGVPVGAFGKMAKAYTEFQAKQVEALQQENTQAQEEITKDLKNYWGVDYERNMALKDVGMARVAKAMGMDVGDLKAVMNAPIQHTDVAIGNTPAVVKLMVLAANMLGEDAAADMGDVTGRVETMQKELDEIEENISKGVQLSKQQKSRRQEIYEALEQMGQLPGQQSAA